MRPLVATILFALTACAPVPELPAGRAVPGPAPAILPLGDLLGAAAPVAADPGPSLAARAAALRGRAATLRAPRP